VTRRSAGVHTAYTSSTSPMDRLPRLAHPEQAPLVRSPSLAGTVIGRRYRLERLIARGGAGALFDAYDMDLARHVALKLLLPRDTEREINTERFVQEARIASSLRHPNIVEVFDVGLSADGIPFLVMELLEGQSLAAALQGQRRIDLACAMQWLLPVMGAISFAHTRGVLHRDLKPENIFLAKNAAGRVVPKLLDFGIAKRLDQATLTSSGTVVGTPSYMSPEQALAEPLGPASDVWSMGVIWFRCMAGKLPFEADTLTSVLLKIVNSPAPALETMAEDLSPRVAAAVDRALRRDPSRRYDSMPHMACALLESALEAAIAVPEDPDPIGLPDYRVWCVGSTSTLDAPIASLPAVHRAVPAADALRTPRRSASAALLAAVAAGALLLGAWWWTREPEPAPREAIPSFETQLQRELENAPVERRPAAPPADPKAAAVLSGSPPAAELPAAAPSAPTRAPSTSKRSQRSRRSEPSLQAPRRADRPDVMELETHWQ